MKGGKQGGITCDKIIEETQKLLDLFNINSLLQEETLVHLANEALSKVETTCQKQKGVVNWLFRSKNLDEEKRSAIKNLHQALINIQKDLKNKLSKDEKNKLSQLIQFINYWIINDKRVMFTPKPKSVPKKAEPETVEPETVEPETVEPEIVEPLEEEEKPIQSDEPDEPLPEINLTPQYAAAGGAKSRKVRKLRLIKQRNRSRRSTKRRPSKR